MSEREKKPAPASYSESERQQVISHIERYFGECSHFYIMDDSLMRDLNLLVFAPTEAQPYYTMVTLGMGGCPMDIPEILRSEDDEAGRVELVGRLPDYWKFDAESLREEQWYWPIKLLEYLIRLGVHEGAFLDYGYKRKDLCFGDTTNAAGPFTSVILLPPVYSESDFSLLKLDNGKEIRFCEIGTFFGEETAFVDKYSFSDLNALIKGCPDSAYPVFMDQKRRNYGTAKTLALPWARELIEQLDKSRDTFSKYMAQMMEHFSSEEHHHHHHHDHDHDHDHE